MAAASQAPSGLDTDPTAYLALPRFNNTLDFTFAGQPATATYALTAAPPGGAWPVLIFFNGLGGHRLIAAMIEGIASAHRVQILTVDKPGAGGSARGVSLPLAHRTRWMHAALLAVLAHTRTTRFAVLSHSNGLFYALHTLLHLPPALTATRWTLSGPFVPPALSGSAALRLAAALPAPLPNALGALLQVVPPLGRAVSWSGGLLAAVSPGPALDAEATEQRKPAAQRGYMHRHVGGACRAAIMRRGMGEARVAMGQEALFCLHGADPAPDAEGGGDSVWGLGPGTSAADVLHSAFARLAARYPDDALGVRVVYGAADGMVPAKGRAWLRGVLEGAGLLRGADAWREVPGAGHDDVLFLEEVVGAILGRVGEAEPGRVGGEELGSVDESGGD
ncbi:hypothetical protein B0H17DRAFT_1201939 [Mycena rosella]|uniref:AB hydrolase-1 domain-containing protein n=1 Tax=Mycena rosella TaxID=1033263 RepID=A0AAD7DEN9_MYCRO|nr:hypothetical protein B0H17DRAFT_1201939 [Mycena rosella]